MTLPNRPEETAQPINYIGWSAEDILALTNFVLIESFQDLQNEECLLEYKREIRQVREKVLPCDVEGFFFSEEQVLLGIFVHTRSIPKDGIHKLLF